MDILHETNHLKLCGTLADKPVFSHLGRGEEFYGFPLEVSRLSGAVDRVNIIARKSLLDSTELDNSDRLLISGQLRSYNNRSPEGARLVITVLAESIGFCSGEDENSVFLTGTLCKPPKLRSTPMGRDICDLMLAVNRRYGRSDYLPCICWGRKALEVSSWDVGTRLSLEGRLQSRKYIKITPSGAEERTAFEVSVSQALPAAKEYPFCCEV